LESSKIAASVRFAQMAGLQNVVNTAEDFGLPMKGVELLPRLATGWEAVSMKEAVRAISAFARAGATAPLKLTYVDRVQNAEGSIVYERRQESAERREPIKEDTAFIIHSMMRSGMEHGSAAGLGEMLIEKPFSGAGKTGTTHDFSDNWFLGYNGRVSCGVWVGFLQPGKSIYEGAFSKDLAMPVWADAMNACAKDFGGKVIPQPESVQEVKICSISGQRATPYCYETVIEPTTGRPRTRSAEISEFFPKNSPALPVCSIHSGTDRVQENAAAVGLSQLAVIDTTPVRAKEAVLLGDDPYFTEQLLLDGMERPPVRKSNNVLDSFDLGDGEKPLQLPWPKRIKIIPE
jgi:penicillin-binding protein 1A